MTPLDQPTLIEGTFLKGIIYKRPRAGSKPFTWGVEIEAPDGEIQLWKTMRSYETDRAAVGAMKNWVVGFRFHKRTTPSGLRLVDPNADHELALRDVTTL